MLHIYDELAGHILLKKYNNCRRIRDITNNPHSSSFLEDKCGNWYKYANINQFV